MVFKKPYAFLIKHFKLLHLILAGIMIYLSVRINLISGLFNSLASNLSVSLVSLADKYISVLMYFGVILILIVGFVIWFLMNNKKKPNKFYISLLLYYILLLVFIIIYNNTMITLESSSMTNQALRVYRDISFLFPLGQYYFIVISILRGIGFNIKQFNFSKDIKDLEISEEDSEEIEVNLSSNLYKYERAGRKRLRELKYYFFENKFWILIILGIILVGGLIFLFVNYKFVNNNYSEGSFVNAGNYRFEVNKTMIVDKNLYGEIVKKDKKYVIVDISVKNNYYENIRFDTSKFRLYINDKYYTSTTTFDSDFKDLGLSYNNKYLDLENIYNYILIYEIDEIISNKTMKLRVYDRVDYETSKVNYININLKPVKLNYKILKQNVEIDKNIVIDEENFGTTNITIKDYSIINNYEYNYQVCIQENCSKKTGVISANNILKNKLIAVKYNLFVDKESNLYNFVKNDIEFYNTFATITYTLNGDTKNIKFNSITNSNISNIIFMEVPKDIDNADSIELAINTRKTKYIYKLK